MGLRTSVGESALCGRWPCLCGAGGARGRAHWPEDGLRTEGVKTFVPNFVQIPKVVYLTLVITSRSKFCAAHLGQENKYLRINVHYLKFSLSSAFSAKRVLCQKF